MTRVSPAGEENVWRRRLGAPGWGADWAGVQCKGKTAGYGSAVTVEELRTEVAKAKTFKPALHEFAMATTSPKDAKIEEEARVITADHRQGGLFSVHVWGWEDVSQALCRYPALLDKHYPNLGPTLHSIARTPLCQATDLRTTNLVPSSAISAPTNNGNSAATRRR